MGQLFKGICIFPNIFTPKVPTTGGDPKYGMVLVFPPDDPQVNTIWSIQEQAKQESFPSGMPHSSTVCFMGYDEMFQGKDYYDPRFSGWWALSMSAKATDKPVVIDGNHTPIIDPGTVYSGCIVEAYANIGGFMKGKKGIGCWFNGVRFCGEVGQFGRLDGRPTTDQMFGQSAPGHQAQQPPQQPGNGFQQPPQQPGNGQPTAVIGGVPTRF